MNNLLFQTFFENLAVIELLRNNTSSPSCQKTVTGPYGKAVPSTLHGLRAPIHEPL